MNGLNLSRRSKMEKFSQKETKKALINIIKNSKIEDVIYEPRWNKGYELSRTIIGATMIIRISLKK